MKKKVFMTLLALVISVTASAQCTVYLLKDGEHASSHQFISDKQSNY